MYRDRTSGSHGMRCGIVGIVSLFLCGSAHSLSLRQPRRGGGTAKTPRMDKINLAATFAAGALTLYDIGTEAKEVGLHHHSLTLVCVSKLCRKFAGLEKIALKAKKNESWLRRTLINHGTMRALCFAAIGGSAFEVWKDFAPGAHHGVLLLSVHELHDVLEDAAGEGASLFQRLLENRLLKLGLAAGALAFASFELVEDFVPGAHHGIAALALAHILKTMHKTAGQVRSEWRPAAKKEE